MIRFQIGNFVVIGSDIDIYDIAKVDSVNEASKDLYYQADLRKQELKVLRKYRQPWRDTCPINSVIMCLGSDAKITKEILDYISAQTKEIYS